MLSVERNEVTDLGDAPFIETGAVFGQGQSGRNSQRLIPGQPLGTFWGPKFLRRERHRVSRCSPAESASTGCSNGETIAPTGDDEMIIGNANPNSRSASAATAARASFDASWLWRGEFGTRRVQQHGARLLHEGQREVVAQLPRGRADDPTGINEPAIYSSRWIENGRFIRLQNATVGYTFALPGSAAAARRASTCRATTCSCSPRTRGYDPEVFVDAPGVATRGIDYLTYPRARTFTARRPRRVLSVSDRTALSPTIPSYEAYAELSSPGRSAE